MSITLARKDLQDTIERAIRVSDRDVDIPADWVSRSDHIAECPSQTFVAMFGTALLAKATNPEVNALSIKADSGTNGYSARSVVSPLVEASRRHGFTLGVTGKEPLNNQPFFAFDRVDRITASRVRGKAKDYLPSLKAYLADLNELNADEALFAFAAFVTSRRAHARRNKRPGQGIKVAVSAIDLEPAIRDFITVDTENGKRGQAFAAAALDCIYPTVVLGQIHHPDGIDVEAWSIDQPQGPPRVACQVKQKPVGMDVAHELAQLAADGLTPSAILVAVGKGQKVLDREEAESIGLDHGVSLAIFTSVMEVLYVVSMFGRGRHEETATVLIEHFVVRLGELGADPNGIEQFIRNLEMTFD